MTGKELKGVKHNVVELLFFQMWRVSPKRGSRGGALMAAAPRGMNRKKKGKENKKKKRKERKKERKKKKERKANYKQRKKQNMDK